ncbi:DEAD/DEAH box helicase [Limnospira fusiformis]|uniref:DEAD/DEAH box helicase n=1 Tax=Limnospira fusiformis TaxID=54297 RepID=UPI0034E07881
MFPSVVAAQIRNCVSDYLITTFRPTTPGFNGLIERFLKTANNLYRGPYVSVGLPFRQGTIGGDYFPEIPLGFIPFLHQERAFNRLSPPNYQSTIIATGTGSGKTECFLIPLLEHCRQQGNKPGIKAILIYPMNALATDQSKRIAQIIEQTPSLKGQVTAGLYVGEKDEKPTRVMTPEKVITDKEMLRKSPPDILLTNYKMLDYLLIRPDLQSLWTNNEPETLRYLVVDEFHTFDGAQGTDLACLLRRLKHRLQTPPGHLACVGTSATLGNKSDKTEILAYSKTIFKEEFEAAALIEEDRLSDGEFLGNALLNVLPLPRLEDWEKLQPDNYTDPENYLQTQAQLWLNPTTETDTFINKPIDDQWRVELGKELKSLPIIHNLIRVLKEKSCTYEEILDRIGSRLHFPVKQHPEYCYLLLDSIFALISAARCQIDNPNGTIIIAPWVTLRVQVWFRELKRMVASVESQPELAFSDDLTPELRQNQKTLPVMHCRDCGATGWGGVRHSTINNKLIPNDLRGFYQAFFSQKPLVSFLFPCDESHEETQLLCRHCLTVNPTSVEFCKGCHKENNADNLIPVLVPEVTQTVTRNGQEQLISNHDCPFCGNSNGLSILGAQAASLTSASIGILYTTPFNQDKKLLTFSDSVQDAAHRAGFYNARTYRSTLRTSIFQLVRESQHPLTLQELCDRFADYWREKIPIPENYIATFLPTDLQWLREWDDFLNGDRSKLDPHTALPDLLELVEKRLVWEIVTQFGHRGAIGPSLERSGVASVSFNPQFLTAATKTLHQKLSNEIEALRTVSEDRVRELIVGLLHHLRHRGGIVQPVTQGNYISSGGETYLLSKLVYMPGVGPSVPAPKFLVNAAAKTKQFERVISGKNRDSWCEDWTMRVFAPHTLLLKEQLIDILHFTLETLVGAKLLESHFCGQGRAWGIPMAAIIINPGGKVLTCDRCYHQITHSRTSSHLPETCRSLGCQGHYHEDDQRPGLVYYRQMYQQGEVRRIVAAEHTGLLSRTTRERLEHRFIQSDRYCDPNLISATSTLEMGINIGDLSSVFLCSLPPNVANYQQRIGRAGRRDGNALVGVIANAKPHDLFFYSDPAQMLEGGIEASGCYLNAAAILERQLTAFCLDNWVASGLDSEGFSPQLNDILNHLQNQAQNRFPYNWLRFIDSQQGELLREFIDLFADTITPETQAQIEEFMHQGQGEIGGLGWRILNRLEGMKKERHRFSNAIVNLTKKIKAQKGEPTHLQDPDKLAEMEQEKEGLREIIRDINNKNIFNFLTDEGLLPNYAFPEAGVTLRSMVLRKLRPKQGANGKRYEVLTMTYERPSQVAIRELVPSGVFYAEGRRVKVDQIDLKLSEPQEWRICRSCSYATESFQPEAHQKTCPRCNDTLWSDKGRLRTMLRLRQVMATTADQTSRLTDDSEDRKIEFFEKQLLVDFLPEFREQTFLINHPEFPFGFEYISRTKFREINLGESLSTGETVEIAGKKFTTKGFTVCRSCGKVIDRNKDHAQNHAISCQWRDKPDQVKTIEVLYLYREFESESIRFLMPDESFWTPEGLHSFIAALQLGLKEKFRGKVDHLRTTISEEPQPESNLRKSFLYLFDSIPGGTGYLRQLIRQPQELQEVFLQALEKMRTCSCKERHQDGCYQCIFAYRNSFYKDYTSRKKAESLLGKLLNHWSELKDHSEGLSAIRVNSNLESELERNFIKALSMRTDLVLKPEIIDGKTAYFIKLKNSAWIVETQVTLDEKDGVTIPCRADFIMRPASSRVESLPVVVFTDGWEYHRDRIKEDFQQRQAIVRSGRFWCWSLTWDDVMKQVNRSHRTTNPPPDSFRQDLNNDKFRKCGGSFYKRYDCEGMQLLESQDSFAWLMSYLDQPQAQNWQRWALLRTLAQGSPANNKSPEFLGRMETRLSPEAIALWEVPPTYVIGEVCISESLQIFTLVDLKRNHEKNATGSLVCLELDDQQEDPGSWREALRSLNLYQFLPHFYAITTNAAPEISLATPGSIVQSPLENTDPRWEELRELVIEESLFPAIDRMSQENWPLPQAGYELLSDRGSVKAIGELAWEETQIVVTLTPEDNEAFIAAGWRSYLVEDFLKKLTINN